MGDSLTISIVGCEEHSLYNLKQMLILHLQAAGVLKAVTLLLLFKPWFHCLDCWGGNYSKIQIRGARFSRLVTDLPVLLTNCTQMAKKMSNEVSTWCFLQSTSTKMVSPQEAVRIQPERLVTKFSAIYD